MHTIAVFDIDGTVYREAMSFIVAEELISRYGFTAEAAKLADARHIYKSRGSTEAYWVYNKAILDIFKRILRQTAPAQLNEVIGDLLNHKKDYCYAYTTQLIRQYKDEGRVLVAISGSIADIVTPFATSLGFDHVVASGLEVVDGHFTGERATETKHGKDQVLRDLAAKHGLSLEGSIGIGDTHRDTSFMKVTEQAIAFNPNAALYEEAVRQGWNIVLERKNMIYELTPADHKEAMTGDEDAPARSITAPGYSLKAARPIFDDHHQEHLR